MDPKADWKTVVDFICSCKCIISSSLHGLICADAYSIPNVWLDEHKLPEGHFKFMDYFSSQNRTNVRLNTLDEFSEDTLYREGNRIDIDKLVAAFPFS